MTIHYTFSFVTPSSVTKENEKQVWFDQYVAPQLQSNEKFKEGDLVRMLHIKNTFTREYSERWTGERFSVTAVSAMSIREKK